MAALDAVDDQMYSWSWEFQPFHADFGIPPVLTRSQALDQLSSWQVDWVTPDMAPLARAMFFDDTGFEEYRTFFGMIRRIELRPIAGVDLLSNRSAIKLQSVRSVKTFKLQVEESFSSIPKRGRRHWAVAIGECLGGEFVEIDRRGCFVPTVEPCRNSHVSSDHVVRPEALFRGEIVSRARELAGSEKCLAFVPHGKPVANVTLPAAPWAWLRELRRERLE